MTRSPNSTQTELHTQIAPESHSKTAIMAPISTFSIDPAPSADWLKNSTPRLLGLHAKQNSNPEAPILAALQTGPIIKPAIRSAAQIKSSQRKAPQAQTLTVWNLKQLVASQNPLDQGLSQLLQLSAQSVARVLFLALTAPETGDIPAFVASGGVATPKQMDLWTGLVWNPELTPELWNLLIDGGLVEFSPPNDNTNALSHRNLVRATFGVTGPEWLTLVRAGTIEQCSGLLALVGATSLLIDGAEALRMIHSPPESNVPTVLQESIHPLKNQSTT